jgi:hypothetical protein
MPVFFYLTDEEAADVYLYLTLYAPTQQSSDSPLVAASAAVGSHSGQGPGSHPPNTGLTTLAAQEAESERDAEVEKAAVSMTGITVAFALVGGLAFTLREFKRLSAESTRHSANSPNVQVDTGTSGRTHAVYRAAPLFFGDAKRSSR